MGAELIKRIRLDALAYLAGAALSAVGVGMAFGLAYGLIAIGSAIMLLTIIW